jgi:hypothetical protein
MPSVSHWGMVDSKHMQPGRGSVLPTSSPRWQQLDSHRAWLHAAVQVAGWMAAAGYLLDKRETKASSSSSSS